MAVFFGVLAGGLSLLGVIIGSFMWLNEPVDADPVPLRALVMERADAGNCDDALILAELGVIERAFNAASIWETVRYETECVNVERADRYDFFVETIFTTDKNRISRNMTDSEQSAFDEWINIGVSDAPPGSFLLTFRRFAFAERCYSELDFVGLPIELRLRRLIMLEFPDIDLVSDLPRARMDGCAAAA